MASLVFYNPLEALILLTGSWILRGKKFKDETFKFKSFIIRCIIISNLNFVVQYLERYFQNSIYYGLYLIIENFLLMGLILKIIGYNNDLFKISFIMLLFDLSLSLIIDVCGFPTSMKIITNSLLFEFCANVWIRFLQAILILIIYGGTFMF